MKTTPETSYREADESPAASPRRPIHVIAVAHGSRNRPWVDALNGWFRATQHKLDSALGDRVRIELAFLEISPPSFEERLRAALADSEPLFILPFFLSQSGFTSKTMTDMARRVLADRPGKWAILLPRHLPAVLGANSERRLLRSGACPGNPVIVSGYGESGDDSGWRDSLLSIQRVSGRFAREPAWLWAPSGHFLKDSRAPLRRAIEDLRRQGHRRLAILPLYLAESSYQHSLIPEVLREFRDLEFAFRPDAILPDPALADWAADLVARAIRGGAARGEMDGVDAVDEVDRVYVENNPASILPGTPR